MKQAKLKSIIILFAVLMLSIASIYALTVTLNHPASEWITSNSVDINFTPLGTNNETVLDWCAVYANNTGTWALKANYSFVPNGTPFVRGIAMIDSVGQTYIWNALCYDGDSSEWDSSNNTFGVDASFPSVTLDSPISGSYLTDSTGLLLYTPTDSKNLEDCDVYTNLSGSWAVNQTNATVDSGVQDRFNLSGIADGVYIWNVVCNQTSEDSTWANTGGNRTFTLDIVSPTAIKFLTSNNTYSNDSTPEIKWNQTTEDNFWKYEVRVSTNKTMNAPFQKQIITTITGNSTTLTGLGADGRYYIQVEAFDLAGHAVNITGILWYNLDQDLMTVSLNAPANGSYLNDNTPDFNVTVTDDNPDSCVLYLSNSTAQNLLINVTDNSITSAAITTLTPTTMIDGTYKYNMGCNDSNGLFTNISSTLLDLTIDTVLPTNPFILSTWHQTNSTDTTPTLSWATSSDTNFYKYVIEAKYQNNATVIEQINVSTRTTVTTQFTGLNTKATYNFSVQAIDLAGNINVSVNTTNTLYYVDSVCGTLNTGWNLCGAVWTSHKNLSVIGSETDAFQLAIWNSSNQWSTCNYAVSTGGTNCKLNVSISNDAQSHAVWVFVNSSTEWGRTWVATGQSSNITLSNINSGWNLEAGFFRNGIKFGDLGNNFAQDNVTQFSLIYNNGTTASYINKGLFASSINYNQTLFDYGRGMWIYYNETPNNVTTWPVGSW